MERHRPARPLTRARYLILAVAAGLLAVTIACRSAATAVPPTAVPSETPTTAPTSTGVPTETAITGPFVHVDKLVFPVEVAADSEERTRGLSERASLDSGTGMLFVFENPKRFRFWMKGMEFPLDIVWISSGCEVVDISFDVPFPDPKTPLDDLPRYSPESTAKYVLEINGGETAALGLRVGDPVKFLGELDGKYDC